MPERPGRLPGPERRTLRWLALSYTSSPSQLSGCVLSCLYASDGCGTVSCVALSETALKPRRATHGARARDRRRRGLREADRRRVSQPGVDPHRRGHQRRPGRRPRPRRRTTTSPSVRLPGARRARRRAHPPRPRPPSVPCSGTAASWSTPRSAAPSAAAGSSRSRRRSSACSSCCSPPTARSCRRGTAPPSDPHRDQRARPLAVPPEASDSCRCKRGKTSVVPGHEVAQASSVDLVGCVSWQRVEEDHVAGAYRRRARGRRA